MGLSVKRDLDKETKLFTALGFGEKQTTEPFLSGAHDIAYTHATENISLNPAGEAVVNSLVDGHYEQRRVISFSNSEVSLPKSMNYDVKVDGEQNSHIDLSADIFGSGNSFKVRSDGKIIEGECTTKKGITNCDETIKDEEGNLLLRGHMTADIYKSPLDFQRTTSYRSPSDQPLGTVVQHVQFDKATNTLNAETWVKRAGT